MKLLVTNIAHLCGTDNVRNERLCGAEMQQFGVVNNAYLLVEDGRIAQFGPKTELTDEMRQGAEIVDARGGTVMPSWCDAHTHIVYAGSREGEFVDKIRGLSYEEIARRGGGILNSADLLHDTPEDELYRQALGRAREVMAKGTGCIEVKSGYGLNLDDELKMLRVVRRLRDELPMRVVSTFLGAHAVARGWKQADYVDCVVNEMLPEVGRQGLADFVDVFCDEGFFTVAETDRILEAAARRGLKPKIHAEELAPSGGVAVGVKHGALSVDHLERMADESIRILQHSATIPTALPGTSFFLNMPYAPARKMLNAGLPLAVASDYNPGSTPSGDMKFVVSPACIKLRLTPPEAFNAATLNGAAAMGLGCDYGSIARGKVANFFITAPISSPEFIAYAYTTPVIARTFLQGREV